MSAHRRSIPEISVKRSGPWTAALSLSVGLALTACGGGGSGGGNEGSGASGSHDAAGVSAAMPAEGEDALRALAVDSFTWQVLVGENTAFNVPANSRLRYGRPDIGWVEKTVSGAGVCTNTFFNFDPTRSGYRHCYIAVATPSAPVRVPANAIIPTDTFDAVRLANQATFGPNEALVADIRAKGRSAWIVSQMQMTASSRYTSGGGDGLHRNPSFNDYCQGKSVYCWRDEYSTEPLLWDFYRNAMRQPDQLRQRVALALQQILVVSGLEQRGTYGFRNYHNMLLSQAFGNYREILKKVSLSPVMGDYLNNVNNNKLSPNENYARELLQLFSVGACNLQANGALAGGRCVATYDNETVRAYAYALTGWTYPAGGTHPSGCRTPGINCAHYGGDMVPAPSYHDTSERKLLSGVTVPAGSSAPQALEKVLDSLMAHPNTAPFVAKQLIQHLVSSSPSPEYVQRVANAFRTGRHNDFGSDKPGDMEAIVAAVLLDTEARETNGGRSAGKLREPVLMFTGVLRALNGQTDGDTLSWTWGGRHSQHLFRPVSVFNFYPPDYPLAGSNQTAPVFAIHHVTTALERLNFLTTLIDWGGAKPNPEIPNATGTSIDTRAYLTDAADAEKLIDRLATLATGKPLQGAARATVLKDVSYWTASRDSVNWKQYRVNTAAYLIFASPQYHIQY
jgi:uncharacterized protein (DUF1800 family)